MSSVVPPSSSSSNRASAAEALAKLMLNAVFGRAKAAVEKIFAYLD